MRRKKRKMVSSDVGGGATGVDCSIGSIVWVRRRNGSWWPGKILGADELSASHVMSPRSGTPVKLLGREDASVDWYNLEKSKRVKSFRCGEFDDCIERAEATQGMPPKKREKYARREDAILHALELEKQALARKYGKAGPVNRRQSKLSNGARGELMPSEKQEIGKSLALSLMDKGKGRGQPRRVKDDYEFCDDDYNPGITPRMRALGDFGPKFPQTVPNGPQKILSLDSAKTRPNDSPKLEDASDGNENPSDRRKRPHEGSGDDSLAKRRERRLPLHHVLENSSKSPSPHLEADGTVNLNLVSEDESRRYNSFQHGDLEEDNMGSTEDTETDSSETDSQDSDSDDLASLSEGAASIELHPKYPRRSSDREELSMSSEEVDENEASHPGYTDPASTMGISRWQHKGKRNVRNLVKKPEGSEKSFSWLSMEEINAHEAGSNGLGPQIARYGSRTTQWDWSSQYLDPTYPGRREYVGRSMFVDVEVKVQSNTGNKREHVPMISLRSKSTDQAIIGHPLQVEALENNSTDSLFVENEDWYPDMQENDAAALTPTWRTARRTANVRIPRPSFTAAGDESYRRGTLINSPIKPSSRKPQKKISLSGNQKTRTLSSIPSLPKKSIDPRRNVPKPELSTTVACIPVKLVFSRLQEDLFGRHP